MNDLAHISPLDELRASVSVPFEQARAMPKSVYTSPEFLALEQRHIFAREWICAGRADTLKYPGDYLTMQIAGEPVVVLRDNDGRLRAMSNVCRHRMSTLLQGRGNSPYIVCPYHAWTYGLDGGLRGAPAMTQTADFCKDRIALPQIRCEDWLGWILVSLDPDAPSPHQHLAQVESLVGYLDMPDYIETFREEFRWDTNWKVLVENFMESYHQPICSADINDGGNDLNLTMCPEGTVAFNYHWIVKNDLVPLALAHPSNTRLQGDQRRITWQLAIYPSLLITLTPGYFWYLSLSPDGPGGVNVLFGGGMYAQWMADPDAERHLADVKAMLDVVNIENKGCTEKVYRGLSARMATPGPLSRLERRNFEFARYVAGRMP